MHSIMNFVNQAALLNAEGVHALTLGDAVVAHLTFAKALHALSNAAQFCSRATDDEEKDWYKAIVSACDVPGLNGNIEVGGFYVCNNALLFDLLEGQAIDSAIVAICCHCTMFNMALSLHQRGMLAGTRRHFISAARLYEQCLRLSDAIDGPVDDVNILVMSTWNNLAHLQAMLGDFDKALENLQTVQHLVCDTDVERCASPGLARSLQIDDVILNVLVTRRPTAAACA
jgi:tetratricopeptide (TPR) repeat protein